jgi:hypothetical protein
LACKSFSESSVCTTILELQVLTVLNFYSCFCYMLILWILILYSFEIYNTIFAEEETDTLWLMCELKKLENVMYVLSSSSWHLFWFNSCMPLQYAGKAHSLPISFIYRSESEESDEGQRNRVHLNILALRLCLIWYSIKLLIVYCIKY